MTWSVVGASLRQRQELPSGAGAVGGRGGREDPDARSSTKLDSQACDLKTPSRWQHQFCPRHLTGGAHVLVIAMMHGDSDHMMSGWMSGWMVLWGALALALLVLAVVATIWLVKHLSGSSGSEHQRLLERRYAAGEIDRDEFLQRRNDLTSRR